MAELVAVVTLFSPGRQGSELTFESNPQGVRESCVESEHGRLTY